MRRRILIVALALCATCTTVRVPQTDLRAARQRIAEDRIGWAVDTVPIVRFDVPFVYHMFKAQVESCSGKHKEGFPALFVAPTAPLPYRYALAVYSRENNSIVFALGSEVMPWVIRHELLHWLLAPTDTKDHPSEWFSTDPTIGRCAPLLQEG